MHVRMLRFIYMHQRLTIADIDDGPNHSSLRNTYEVVVGTTGEHLPSLLVPEFEFSLLLASFVSCKDSWARIRTWSDSAQLQVLYSIYVTHGLLHRGLLSSRSSYRKTSYVRHFSRKHKFLDALCSREPFVGIFLCLDAIKSCQLNQTRKLIRYVYHMFFDLLENYKRENTN